MSEFRLINTNGGVALLLGKYKYHKHKNYADGSVYWRCSSHKKLKCHGTVTTKVGML